MLRRLRRPRPRVNNVIDNFQNGLNDTESPWLVQGGKTPGYLSDYTDSASKAALCPTYTGTNPEPGFCLDIAAGAGLPVVVQGVPGFTAHLSDTSVDFGNPTYGYCGMGFFFDNAQPAGGTDISQTGTFKNIVFYAKSTTNQSVNLVMNDSATYQDNCYAPSINYYNFVAGAAWAAVTIDFNPADAGYNLGSPSIASGTNGCTINVTSPHNYSYTTAEQIQWQPQGSAPGAVDLSVADIYLQ